MVKSLKKFPVKLILFCVPFFSYSQIPQADTTYFQSSVTKKLEVIISESYKKDSPFIHQYSRQFYAEYKSLFRDSPYNKSFLVFISPRKQILNGHSLINPLSLIYIYSNINDAINQVASHNWLQDSLAHEMVHLYQINAQGKFSYLLRWIFPPVFWFVYPNIYTHRLILEGSAILFESIYGTGGRLFSGWVRAFVFSQLKNRISLKRIFNNYNDLFSTKEKYFHGGYFFSFLLENHSLKEINNLFFHHRNPIVFPSEFQSINWAFYKTFGDSFESLFKQYETFYLKKALKQKQESAPPLFKSSHAAPLNSDSENIYFMTSNGKSQPSLMILNKKTEKTFTTKQDMPMGKVFSIDNSFYSTGTGYTSTLVSETSLFKHGYIHLEKYNSRYVMDIKNNKVISFDTKKGPVGFPLLINNSFYDFIHSTAIMDEKGQVYYFKQNKEIRTLYRDKTPLWSFKGYYSFPVEADKEGLYFIGSTEYGSGLFSYTKGDVFRLSPSDTIIAGRKIRKDRFLVTEITPSNYEYKIINTGKINEQPFLYKYNFKKQHDFLKPLIKESFKESTPDDTLKAKIHLEEKNINLHEGHSLQHYNPLSNLKFQDMIFIPIVRSLRPIDGNIYFQARWTDPLQQNLFAFFGSSVNKSISGGGKYIYKKFRPQLEFSYLFKRNPFAYIENKPETHIAESAGLNSERFYTLSGEDFIWKSQSFLFSSYKFSKTQIALKYPIIRRENWKLSFLTKVGLGKESFTPSLVNIEKKTEKKPLWTKENSLAKKRKHYSSFFINQGSGVQFEYNKKYPEAFGSHKRLNLNLYYDSSWLKTDKNFHLTLGGQLSFEKELGKEWYLSGSGRWINNLQNPFLSRFFKNREKHTFWSYHNFIMPLKTKKYKTTNMILKKVLNHSFYTLTLPVSFKRWAPLAGASFFFTSGNKSSHSQRQLGKRMTLNPSFVRLFIGGEAEFSFNYNVDILTGISGGPVLEFENFRKKYNHGFYTGLYLKAVF